MALPLITEFGDATGTRVQLRGHLTPRRARGVVRVARATYRDVVRRFGAARPPVPEEPVQVCLFATAREYSAFVRLAYGSEDHSPLGFYVPAHRVVVANLSRGNGNLRHELAHSVLGDGFPRIPGWLNEGIGSLYGSARIDGTRMHFLVNYRLRSVHAALRDGTLPTLEELASADRGDVYGPRASTFYGMARYLLLYLDRRGQLTAFYQAIESAEHDAPVLEEFVDYDRFRRWVSRLRYPPRR